MQQVLTTVAIGIMRAVKKLWAQLGTIASSPTGSVRLTTAAPITSAKKVSMSLNGAKYLGKKTSCHLWTISTAM